MTADVTAVLAVPKAEMSQGLAWLANSINGYAPGYIVRCPASPHMSWEKAEG